MRMLGGGFAQSLQQNRSNGKLSDTRPAKVCAADTAASEVDMHRPEASKRRRVEPWHV